MFLRIERRRSHRHAHNCHNACRTSTKELRRATHIAWLLGRETYLCSPCAKVWQETYAGAVGEAVAEPVRERAWSPMSLAGSVTTA